MTQEIPVFQVTDNITDITSALDEAGCAVIQNVTSDDTIGSIQGELSEHMANTFYSDEDDPNEFYPAKTRRVTALLARSKSSHELALNPVVKQLSDHHLLPNCENYRLHVSAALEIGPGAREQVLHREEDPFTFFAEPRPNLVIASMWAMSDFNKENGATLLVPGSHRWSADRQATPDEIKVAEMPKGSVMVWLGGTLHAAGANVSDEWRYGIILSYSLGWLRQEENQALDLPPNIANEASQEIRDLAGYTMHGSLGLYDPAVSG